MRLLLLLLLLCACRTVPKEERAVFTVDVEPVAKTLPKPCSKAIDIKYGALPHGAVELTRVTVTTSKPVSLQEIEAVLGKSARQVCADGVHVLQAIVEDGGTMATSVNAVAWMKDPQPEPLHDR